MSDTVNVEIELFCDRCGGELSVDLYGRVECCPTCLEEEYDRGREEGYEKGMVEGERVGFDTGYNEGFDKGKEYGYSEGFDDASAEIEARENTT